MGQQSTVEFYIDGGRKLVPFEWAGIKERWEFGTNSNQPNIEAERFTFSGDSGQYIYDQYKKGYILRGIPVSVVYKQGNITTEVIKDYIIDLTDDFEIVDPYFGTEKEAAVSIKCKIKKKNGLDNLLRDIGGTTWGYLDSIGKVGSGDYTTVKTAVVPVYSNKEVAIAILSILVIRLQIKDAIESTQQLIADTIDKFSTLDPAEQISAVIWVATTTVIRAAAVAFLLATLVSTVLDLLFLLVPPIVKNKGITLKRGLEVLLDHFGYSLSTTIPDLDELVYLPSKPRSNGKNIIKNALPNLAANEKGIPNPTDYGYVLQDFVELVKKIRNVRVDIVDKTVYFRWEDDPVFFRQSKFKPKIDLKPASVRTNINEIPNTRLISFRTDDNDEYTTEYYQGTSFEVTNESRDLPFKGIERIDIPVALGNVKTELLPLEKTMLLATEAADTLGSLIGRNPKLSTQLKSNRTNVLMVSQNNYTVPKLLPMSGGRMRSNAREVLSAKTIENDWYINRSIVRGTGQKLLWDAVNMPFTLEDRNNIVGNGNFTMSDGTEATFRSLEWEEASDQSQSDIQINFDYIANSDVTERFNEPE